jgi:hypothetical protein
MTWHMYPQEAHLTRQEELLCEAESARLARLAREGERSKNGMKTRERIRWAITAILHPAS